MTTQHPFRCALLAAAVLGFIGANAAMASAQPAVTATAGIAFVNHYMFRGVRQNATRMAIWPSGSIGVATGATDGAFKNAEVNFGFWNSLHTGDTGSGGPTNQMWYESDFSVTGGFNFTRGISIGTTYTAYTSPNKMFTRVNELSIRASLGGVLRGEAALHPYALAAFELHTKPGIGQVDGGARAGRYLELGISPGYSARRIGVAIPMTVGLSMGNYYELAGEDHAFGFASFGGIVMVPLPAKAGVWNVHGGIEYQRLGTATKAFNGGEGSKTIASVGIGFAR